jgi:hypothetical protein
MKSVKATMHASSLQKQILFVLVLLVPSFLLAQEKKTPPKPSAPAPKASAPARGSTPAQRSTTTPGRTTPGTGASRTGNNTPNRPGAGGNNSGRTTPNNMGRTGGNGSTGRTVGNNVGGRGAAPGRQVSLRGGGSASIRPNGQIRSVNRNGMQIQRGMHGGRTVVSTRNGVRVVSSGRGGYVQRAYVVRGGRSYYSRTYYYHGVYRTGVYRGYYWGGRPYYGYYPGYYYQPAYYGWAYNPWPAPVYYGWGWGGAPWYGYYGPYYAPYPVYPTAAFWLTDFMIAATLQAAYEAQATSWLGPNAADGTLVASLLPMAAADSEPAKLSPEVKQALSDEVKASLAAEQAEAAKGNATANSSGGQPANSNEAPPALDPNFRTFMVASDMSLIADGDECALSQGDVIQRITDTADGDGNVNVKVVASTKSDCAIGKQGPVAVDDLQEMYNHFREQLKDGMGELAKKQGTGGLPKAPDTSTKDGDVPAPPPDKNAEKALTDQQSAADQAETEVKQEAGSGSGGAQ